MNKMHRKFMVWVLLALGLFSTPQVISADSLDKSGIRSIDFRNFTFPVFGSTAEITKAKSIRVRDGTFNNWSKYEEGLDGSFSFSVESVFYGDITGNGKEEAVVDTLFSYQGASHPYSEQRLYFYSMKDSRPVLLRLPDIGDQLDRDYSQFNRSKDPCSEHVISWSAEVSVKGIIKVDAVVGDFPPRNCYDEKKGYRMVTMYYRLQNNRWVFAQAPKLWRKKRQ